MYATCLDQSGEAEICPSVKVNLYILVTSNEMGYTDGEICEIKIAWSQDVRMI